MEHQQRVLSKSIRVSVSKAEQAAFVQLKSPLFHLMLEQVRQVKHHFARLFLEQIVITPLL